MAALVAEGYNTIFIGVGAWRDYALKIPGEDLKG
jgi:NADPH-dependent glutamate synthase beta subunit-like oxidoreductase